MMSRRTHMEIIWTYEGNKLSFGSIMVLIDDEVLDYVPSLTRKRHASADMEIMRRSSSLSKNMKENLNASRKNSVGSRSCLVDNEPRSRCTSISMRTYKPHLITERRRK